MKLMSELVADTCETLTDRDNKIVHFIASSEGYKAIDPPRWSKEIDCPFCGSNEFFTWLIDKNCRLWICGMLCAGSKLPKSSEAGLATPKEFRAILWPKFCEINGIGDIYHDVRFENIQQSEAKIACLLKFATSPRGIILMRGDPGTGKSYAAMGVCEFFTRKNSSAIFTTQKQMANSWLETFKAERYGNYVDRVNNINLLVIDDFGTAEPPTGFMGFFMDLINSRTQWTNRGTIITSNLNPAMFNSFCGEALSDRILTAQILDFKGNTRRKKTIL